MSGGYSNIGRKISRGQIQGKEFSNGLVLVFNNGGSVLVKKIEMMKKKQNKMDKQ